MRVPLHPGTHLTNRQDMLKLEQEWHNATPDQRLRIHRDVINETEWMRDDAKFTYFINTSDD
jgi:hypothetical protein